MATNQWKLKLFGDLCSSVDGVQIGPFGSQLHASDYVESGIPVVMPKDMINTEISTDSIAYVSEEIANRLSKHRLKAGDLVFARRGDIGRFVIVSAEQTGWLCGTGCIRARFKPNIYPEFISLILQSHSVQHWLKSNAVGQTMLNLNTEIILNLPIRIIDSLESQITLANCIGYWDSAIAITEKLITAKRRLKQGLMQKLLTGKFRITGFKDKSWRTVKLGEVFSERIERAREDLPLLSVTGSMGLIYRDELIRRDTSNSDKSNYKRVASGDIVYNTMRMWQGVSALVNIEGIVSPAYTVVIPNSSLNASFIKHFFKFSNLIHSFHRYSQGLVSDTLTLKFQQFSRIKVNLPEINEQKKIAEILDCLDQEIFHLEAKLKLFQTQKQGLMQQLLTGKIRVQTP